MSSAKYLIAILFMSITILTNAQMAEDSELYVTLKKKDSILFNAAFNQCDVDTMESLFTEDFEFYHDKGGLTEGRSVFLIPARERCSKRKEGDLQRAKRILVEGSLEVYPLYKNEKLYGAIQHGEHSFEFLNEQKVYQKGDIAKFTHVWVLEGSHWKIKRELSYDHHMQQ